MCWFKDDNTEEDFWGNLCIATIIAIILVGAAASLIVTTIYK